MCDVFGDRAACTAFAIVALPTRFVVVLRTAAGALPHDCHGLIAVRCEIKGVDDAITFCFAFCAVCDKRLS